MSLHQHVGLQGKALKVLRRVDARGDAAARNAALATGSMQVQYSQDLVEVPAQVHYDREEPVLIGDVGPALGVHRRQSRPGQPEEVIGEEEQRL